MVIGVILNYFEHRVYENDELSHESCHGHFGRFAGFDELFVFVFRS